MRKIYFSKPLRLSIFIFLSHCGCCRFKLFIVCTLSFFSVLFLSVLVVHYALDCSCTCTWEERKEQWAKIGQKKKETHKRRMQVHVDIHVHVDGHVKEVMEED